MLDIVFSSLLAFEYKICKITVKRDLDKKTDKHKIQKSLVEVTKPFCLISTSKKG